MSLYKSQIVDIYTLAGEVVALLRTSIDIQDPIVIQELTDLIRQLIVCDIEYVLYRKSNRLIRANRPQGNHTVLYNSLNRYHVGLSNFIVNIIDEHTYLRFFYDMINDEIPDGTFELWALNKHRNLYVLETLGDYRIIEWYQDHVIGGKYV